MTAIEFRAAVRGLKPNQIDALNMLAMDRADGVHPKTFEALERRGLIVGRDAVLAGRFPVRYRQYAMPTPVHMAWCDWQASQCDADEAGEL